MATRFRRNGGGAKEAPSNGKKPAVAFKYKVRGGNVEVAVWPNEVKGDGGSYTLYSVSIQRSYDASDATATEADWKTTSSMRTDDIPVLQYALAKAYEWIMDTKNNGTPI